MKIDANEVFTWVLLMAVCGLLSDIYAIFNIHLKKADLMAKGQDLAEPAKWVRRIPGGLFYIYFTNRLKVIPKGDYFDAE